jgi:hypothetical protein
MKNSCQFSRFLLIIPITMVLCLSLANFTWAGNGSDKFVADELLVQAKAGVSGEKMHEILRPHDAATVGEIQSFRVRRIKVPADALENVKAALKKNPHVSFVENNFFATGGAEPNDYQYPSQWHLPKISTPAAWDVCTGFPTEPIAIIDSGVDPTHPDLAGKLLPGYNFIGENTDTQDVLGHGTAVAGTAAAISNNVVGVAGVAWGNPIMPLVVLNSSNYATYYDIARAITYAADQGVRVINISIGGSSSSSTLQNAVDYAWNRGAMVFACAHNYSTSTPYYPAACTHAVAVSATTSSDTLASFSNYGDWIDLAAPGVSILTTTRGGGYGACSGTSFSSPIAAGLAALILSANPSLTNAQVLEIMTQNTDDLGQPGFDPYYGYGRVNAYASLQAAMAAVPQPDVTAPSVAITAPENDSTVSGTVTVTVLATDDIGVESVGLYLNGTLFATASAEPYQFSLDTTDYPDGPYELLAIANDCAGNAGQSGSISVNVSNVSNPQDNIAPTVAITSPADGSSISRTIRITVNASDNVGVSKLELYIDGTLRTVTSQSYLSWSWNTRKETMGQHIISAKAYDQAGNAQTGAITVYNK